MSEHSTSRVSADNDVARLKHHCTVLQERLDRITDINSGIIYVLDANGRFTFLNNAVTEILHYDPKDLIGKHFSEIMSVEEFERVGRDHVLPKLQGKATGDTSAPKLFDERRCKERRTKSIEVQLLTRERKDVKILKGDVSGIMGSEGFYGPDQVEAPQRFLGSQGIIFEITEYKKIEQQRKELERKCYEIQKHNAVGRLAGGAAHHFNNKLGAILGYAELIRHKSDTPNSDINRYLEHIISAAKQSADLTAQLLTFAKEGNYQHSSVNVNELMRDVSMFVTNTIRRNITPRLSLDLRSPAITGNASEIRNAILDIAMNGCDAMGSGGELIFETSVVGSADLPVSAVVSGPVADSYVRCSIIDSGVGMTEDVKARIFEPFFTTKEVGEGIGLGLSFVYGCVLGHNGFIDVQSRPGRGTRFNMYFPGIGEKKEPDPLSKPRGFGLKGSGNIVIADEDEDIRKLMRDILEDQGYSVSLFGNGIDALEYIKTHTPAVDLVIFDLALPHLNGINFFNQVRSIKKDICVMVTTGHIVNDDIETLLKNGVRDIIPKPFDIHRLSQMVHAAVEGF